MDRFRELMARVKAGDPDATGPLFDEYGALLLKVIRRHLSSALRTQVDSADFVQEAWLAFLQNPSKPHFETPQQLGAFLAATARNKVVDAVRRALMSKGYNVNREVRREADAPDVAPSHRETPSKSAMRRDLKDLLLDDLGLAYRKIGLRIFDGVDPADIATEYGVDKRTVERVRKRIVDQLHNYEHHT
jgi:RNA polymerase sigma factor (sigma-70 family)